MNSHGIPMNRAKMTEATQSIVSRATFKHSAHDLRDFFQQEYRIESQDARSTMLKVKQAQEQSRIMYNLAKAMARLEGEL